MPPMIDTRHRFHGLHTTGGVCRIRVYRPAGFPPVVIATELPENTTTSITNMVEELAAEVLARYLEDRMGQERPFLWIEHYPGSVSGGVREADTYDLVTFPDYRPSQRLEAGRWRVRFDEPEWRRLSRDQVERMIGEALGDRP